MEWLKAASREVNPQRQVSRPDKAGYIAPRVLRFVSGSFFPQLRVFNNFSASFFGLLRFVFWGQSFVINNFSGSFFKITSFFVLQF
jgi:hypothetical protein